MGYKFDEHGFMVIPDPREAKQKREIEQSIDGKIVVVRHAFCPDGHDVMSESVNFNGHDGIHLKIRRPDGDEGDMILSPIFRDQTIVYMGTKPAAGEKLDVFCPICGVKLPILSQCENCDGGEIRVLSLSKEFDIANGIAFCDMVGCPSSYILDSDELIEQAYLEDVL